MDYMLTEEQQMLQELVQKIADERIKPVRAELDEKEIFPLEIIKDLAQADVGGVVIPEAYGGLGMGCMENCLVLEALSTACVGVATTYAASFLGIYPILLYGTESQKSYYLPQVARGEKIGAFALTESQAGSDASAIQTTATREGDFYVLNGTKQWITNAGEADVYIIIAITDKARGTRGASALIVESSDPGISFGKKEQKMGIRASSTREIILQNCRIPADRLINKEGLGFIIALKTLDYARPGAGAMALGVAQGALEESVIFARERKQFGAAIISFQAIQHMLANMATELEAARALVYAVARHIDNSPKDFSKEAAMSKLFATDMAMRVTTDAVQILGGHGYMREYPVEKMMRDAKILQIFEGTNQIQRNVIGQALNKEFGKKK
jgi:alkylation response protein AidB-like acyl-CoA dehydrogenase